MTKNKLLSLLSILYLVFPLLFFAYGWLRQPVAGIVLAILLLFVMMLFLDMQRVFIQAYENHVVLLKKWESITLLRNVAISFGVLLIWTLFSGIGGFGFQAMDYLHHNALFKELIESPWPLTTEWKGQILPVVYYLGWYLPSAFVGKLYGWALGNIACLVWGYIGVFLSFYWFLRLNFVKSLTTTRLLVALAIFCLAGGLDFIGYYVLRPHIFDLHNLFPLDGWSFLQYSSNTTLMYWVPQHAIPAWLFTGLVMDCIYDNPSNIKYLGISLAGCLLASPFGVIGVIPFGIVFLIMSWQKGQWRQLFTTQSVFLNIFAMPIAVICFLYLTSNKFSFPSGFLWEFSDSRFLLFWGWFEFFMIEVGLLVVFVLLGIWFGYRAFFGKSHVARQETLMVYLEDKYGVTRLQFMLFSASLVVLILLPIYKMGYADDFVMRASIPSLFVFWAFIAKILVDSEFTQNEHLRPFFLTVMCLVLIGFYNSLTQISISVTNYHFGPPDEKNVLTIATGSLPWIVEQRLGSDDSFFYQYLGK